MVLVIVRTEVMNCCKVLQIFVWDILELQNLIEKFQVAWFLYVIKRFYLIDLDNFYIM